MNNESCNLRRMGVSPHSLWNMSVGEFFFSTDSRGQRWFHAMLPGETLCCIPIRPLLNPATNAGHSWAWDGNVDKPTLTPSVNAVGSWHGFITAGRAVSC